MRDEMKPEGIDSLYVVLRTNYRQIGDLVNINLDMHSQLATKNVSAFS